MFDRDDFFVQERIRELRAIAEARRSAASLSPEAIAPAGGRSPHRRLTPWPLGTITAILCGRRIA